MEISDVVEVFETNVAQKPIQPEKAFVPSFQVGGEEIYILGQLFKQRPRHLATQHSNLHIRVLHGQVMDDGYRHGDVAQSGKPYDEQFFHFCP